MCNEDLENRIPRLSSGPWCWSVLEWSYRMCFTNVFTFIALSAIFFWLNATQMEDATDGARAFVVTLAVLFIIPALFSILLFFGLIKENRQILRVWCIYSFISSIIVTLLLLGLGFWFMGTSVGEGFIIVAIAILVGGYLIYTVLIVHSVSMNIRDGTNRL